MLFPDMSFGSTPLSAPQSSPLHDSRLHDRKNNMRGVCCVMVYCLIGNSHFRVRAWIACWLIRLTRWLAW